MAYLLGHRGCMESLRADLRDLQAAIADVSSRVGAARFPSWKFPDKVSCELDMAALLEQYSYTESDPEFSQHAHTVLLELVIDRLLLLLQTFTGYAENLLSQQAVPPTQAVGRGMSVGLTARKYWCSMLKLGASYQQLLDKKAACRKELPTPQPTAWAGSPEEHPKHSSPEVPKIRPSAELAQSTAPSLLPSVRALASDAPASDTPGSSLPQAARSMAPSTPSLCPQATGVLPGSCDTCTAAQASLHQVGTAIADLCQSQNIPSALAKFQEAAERARGRRNLSATDVSFWAAEQSRDLSRINKYLQLLLQQVDPLKAELKELKKEKDKLQGQVEDFPWLLQAERESQAQQRKEAEQHLELKSKEHGEAVARLEQDKDKLQRGTPGPKVLCLSPEVTKTTLLEELRTTTVAKSQLLELEEKVQQLTSQREELEEKVQQLTSQREDLEQKLSTTTLELEKEKAKVESVLRHEESLQAKYRTLLPQLDSLDQERQELQNSLAEVEEDKAKLAEQLEERQAQSGRQQQCISRRCSSSPRLEEQTRELEERERLLVLFPELHSPPKMQLESTGSVTGDMEKQLQANNTRIDVMKQENMKLSAALAKVKEAAEQGVLK
ncbi:CC157 protein, partial [Bucorvus abyssinicus]|nr:CC157 protein [Bucorvus abyssinicus]